MTTTTLGDGRKSAGVTVCNPRNRQTLYTIPEPTPDDIHRAYATAHSVFETLRDMPVAQRLVEAGKLKRHMLANKDRIAQRIVEETGKCRTDALMLEVFQAIDMIDYYEKHAEKTLADQRVKTPIFMLGKRSKIRYEPIGPVLVISPWNYPFHLSFLPVLSAFIAGNPVILKPSSYTPLKGLYEDLIAESGFMKGAIQVVYATRKSADLLIDAKPAKIFLTGSVGAGKKVMERAARHLIPVELELGGKDPMLVFDDVNLDRTAAGAAWGAFANCGQTCTSVERIYVQEGIHDAFLDVLKDKVERLRTLAAPDNGETNLDVGCMTTEFQIEEIETQIADAVARGARLVTGGAREPGSHVFPPTIVADVTQDMRIVQEESFGPIVTVARFKDEDEAVALANDSPFGLSASVWSADLERAERVAGRIVTGNVSINNVLATQANFGLPFGGVKDSGFGRYHGSFGLHTFSNIKSVVVDKQSPRQELNWFPYSDEKYGLLCGLMDSAYSGSPLRLLKTLIAGLRLQLLSRKRRL